ncbi:hypothetical protein F443_13565 [Phytophthora nicotianae P1569]|uniref:Uncharacterized protein n=1 Tax=Phytophthora nicotianae P1569 TaxID=1317065 RepID=V9EPJ5_PHYNI|nr:hypothetical protein F443_13565 [Phytophthora nicotianae P1569]
MRSTATRCWYCTSRHNNGEMVVAEVKYCERGKNFMMTVAFQVLWYLMLNLKNPQKNLMSDFKMPVS